MKNRAAVRFYLQVALAMLAATIAAMALPGLAETWAQISIMPTPTPTSVAPTPTNTPFTPGGPTPTNTPYLPTNTPPPPTSTPTPIPSSPQIGPLLVIEPPDGVAAVGTDLIFTVVVTEPNIDDLKEMVWDWGDSTSSKCPPNSAACTIDWGNVVYDTSTGSYIVTGTVTGRHAYSVPGVYRVEVIAFDVHGQFDAATYEFAVVYDPAGHFVTGGGWLDSPPGAYKPGPALTGKATFGFVSEYKKGASAPTGNTQFQFKAGDLSFQADSYDWLVVNQAGTSAQFKGTGTINGTPGPNTNPYRFMIWAEDGTPDTFRIKIWWEDGSGETAVYDNGFNQPIGGGNIHIQR